MDLTSNRIRPRCPLLDKARADTMRQALAELEKTLQ